MVKFKIILFTLVFVISFSSLAQEKERTWKLNAAFSFAPGFLTQNTQTIQLHGYLGYLRDKIHIRGDAFYYLGAYGDRPRFEINHQIFAGAFYHFTNTKFQPYVGFQPGIAIARSSEYTTLLNSGGIETEAKTAINPVGSGVAGITYYGEKIFFLFAEARYIFGKHKTNTYPVFLDEMRFSFGLGFYL
jgi:hypothetical protein